MIFFQIANILHTSEIASDKLVLAYYDYVLYTYIVELLLD